ncbi:DUF2357 domain-containing protein [Polaribacter sp. Z022]|uniref:DUF2357 domain-containing protein n=1 Tax=Polaribacter sp. Z022 TaxID=2927125 RepID=UPI00201FC9CD|nr:DUF2357 domain-containing protein [Polaribacter sp. Z022]MCL7754936.1 DUF2357 domain-containing protein [Polaribacter sp. Z022]
MEKVQSIKIDLAHIENGLNLYIDTKQKGDIEIDTINFYEHEPSYQLKEGCYYDFEFSDNINPAKYRLICSDQTNIVQSRKRKEHIGIIAPNIFVGTLTLQIYSIENPNKKWNLKLEVQSKKTSYRQDYQYMLNDITSKCTDLIIQANSPVSHSFETDFNTDNKTLYQRFSFVSSIINSEDFEDAIQRIVTSPTTNWTEESELTDVRKIKRFKNSELRSLVNSDNRLKLKDSHPLFDKGIQSIATKIESYRKLESVDTSENRFIKHALETFLKFCMDIANHPNAGIRLKEEAEIVSEKLETHLQHDLFKKVSRPITLKLNSPTLQKKEGYREILKVWLKFDLAAQLVWNGGNEVYSGGKKDIATLYEYWLFFKLLDVLRDVFDIKPKELEKLIVPSNDNLSLQLKQGKVTALKGTYTKANRDLNIKFNYNRSFTGGNQDITKAGSWTTTLRPDYTLSIWPKRIKETEAEESEQIVHIHFDAKYKVANINQILGENKNEEDLSFEKKDNLKGIYKNADLLKMHAYKDAIRRTSGAYVLYPGETNKPLRGFHEILPGLGAFSIKPSENENETMYLENFLKDVLKHFLNTASQRENIAHKTYIIHKNDSPNKISEPIPEYLDGKKIIPDDTFILVGFSKNNKRLKWYKENGIYNFRMDDDKGSLLFTNEVVNAKYLLLRESGNSKASQIFKLKPGIRVFSKEKLELMGLSELTKDNYLICEFEIDEKNTKEFNDSIWDFKKLEEYQKIVKGKNPRIAAGIPFTTTLTKLMNVKIFS